jgi:hypothetical protein
LLGSCCWAGAALFGFCYWAGAPSLLAGAPSVFFRYWAGAALFGFRDWAGAPLFGFRYWAGAFFLGFATGRVLFFGFRYWAGAPFCGVLPLGGCPLVGFCYWAGAPFCGVLLPGGMTRVPGCVVATPIPPWPNCKRYQSTDAAPSIVPHRPLAYVSERNKKQSNSKEKDRSEMGRVDSTDCNATHSLKRQFSGELLCNFLRAY